LRLVAAVPNVEAGPLGLGSLASAIVALLLAFIAVLLVVGRDRLPKSLPLPRRAAASEADHGPTLSESLQMAPPPVAAASSGDATLRRRRHRSLPKNWPPASSAPTTSVAWSAAN
jgi:phosphomannomutase/phosphoglucomutase